MVILNDGRKYGFLKFRHDKIVDTIFGHSDCGFCGSQNFEVKFQNNELKIIEKPKPAANSPQSEQQPQTKYSLNSNNSTIAAAAACGNPLADNPLPSSPSPKRYYKLNKKEVSDRLNAMFNLKIARKYLNFVTITFPKGLPDDLCYRAFNTWLTKLRKFYKLPLYLWITERQKNGTLHYHMMVCQYLPIRIINMHMAITLRNILQNEKLPELCFDWNHYNGVDIRACNSNRKALRNYLIKYVSKNNELFTHYCWHCSRTVSNLFTSYNTQVPHEFYDFIFSQEEIRHKIETEHAIVYMCNDIYASRFNRMLSKLNEEIFFRCCKNIYQKL